MRMSYKKGKDVKKKSKFGMLSVKAGIDKNPNPTQADRIAGAKMSDRKKANIGGLMKIKKISRMQLLMRWIIFGKRLKVKNKVVEAVGIEPTSECTVQMASTCLGHY